MTEVQEKLLEAVKAEDIEKVEELLKYEDPNYWVQKGTYLIHIALFKKNIAVIKALLEKGANPDQLEDGKETPLYKAICRNLNREGQYDPIPEILLDYGADPNWQYNKTEWGYLHEAVNKKNTSLVKKLIDKGADVNDNSNKLKNTPLHFASNIDIVNLLIEAGADVNIKDRRGNQAIYAYVNLKSYYGFDQVLIEEDPENKMFKKVGQCTSHGRKIFFFRLFCFYTC